MLIEILPHYRWFMICWPMKTNREWYRSALSGNLRNLQIVLRNLGISRLSDNLQIVAQSADCADWTICRLLNLNLWIGCWASSQQISVLVSKTIAQLARATFPGYAPPIQALAKWMDTYSLNKILANLWVFSLVANSLTSFWVSFSVLLLNNNLQVPLCSSKAARTISCFFMVSNLQIEQQSADCRSIWEFPDCAKSQKEWNSTITHVNWWEERRH